MKQIQWLVVAALMTIPAWASAQMIDQHLIPESGPLNGVSDHYDGLLRRHLARWARDRYSWIHFLVIPSTDPEESIALEGPDIASASLVHYKAKSSIWHTHQDLLNRLKDRPTEGLSAIANLRVPVDRREASLDEPTKVRLARAWVAFLRMTHYGALEVPGLDHTEYHFVALVKHREVLAGRTVAPPPGSLPGRFVTLATTLGEYIDAAEPARPAVLPKIEKALRAVERPLGLDPDDTGYRKRQP